jgi:hypothetical protein
VKTVTDKLAAARARLNELEGEIAAVAGKRRAGLLAGGDVTRHDSEIARLEHAARTERDRIGLLDIEVARVASEDVAKRKAAKIAHIQKQLDESDALGEQLETLTSKAIETFHQIVRLRGSAVSIFANGDSEIGVAINNYQGMALTASAVQVLLSHELYRQGARVVLPGGAPGVQPEPAWPAPRSPSLDLQMTPEKITRLSVALKTASAYTVGLAKDGRAPAILAAEQPGESRSPAQIKLAEVLKQMAEAAASPERESEYLELVKQSATLTDKVELERAALQSNGATT